MLHSFQVFLVPVCFKFQIFSALLAYLSDIDFVVHFPWILGFLGKIVAYQEFFRLVTHHWQAQCNPNDDENEKINKQVKQKPRKKENLLHG